MERPRKRQRLTIQNDPCIPLEDDRSRFLEASNDMIDLIFRTLSIGLKSKMRLELVCKKFQSRIKSRSTWSGENKLVLGKYDHAHITINEYKFTFENAPSALSKLLDRITVEEFILNDMSDVPLNIFIALCHTVTEHKDFFNLNYIQFCGSFDYNAMIVSLTGCGLENVVEIECGDWNDWRYVDILVPSFYSMLFHCHNLEVFSLRIDEISSIWETLLQALANCHNLTELNLDVKENGPTQQNAFEFAQLCSSNFQKLTTLRFYFANVTLLDIQPLEFLNALNEQIRSNITCLCITLAGGVDIPSHHDCLVTICNLFPKLSHLSIVAPGYFYTETQAILEAIGNIFANYGGHGHDIYKFTFDIGAKNRGEVFMKLASKKWNDNDEFVKIEATNGGIWKCIKNNVEITLDIRGDEEDD